MGGRGGEGRRAVVPHFAHDTPTVRVTVAGVREDLNQHWRDLGGREGGEGREGRREGETRE